MDISRPTGDNCGAKDCDCQPFEFHCLYGDFKISGDRVEQLEHGRWLRIDRGRPERIGRSLISAASALCLTVMLLSQAAALFDIDKPTALRPRGRTSNEVQL